MCRARSSCPVDRKTSRAHRGHCGTGEQSESVCQAISQPSLGSSFCASEITESGWARRPALGAGPQQYGTRGNRNARSLACKLSRRFRPDGVSHCALSTPTRVRQKEEIPRRRFSQWLRRRSALPKPTLSCSTRLGGTRRTLWVRRRLSTSPRWRARSTKSAIILSRNRSSLKLPRSGAQIELRFT